MSLQFQNPTPPHSPAPSKEDLSARCRALALMLGSEAEANVTGAPAKKSSSPDPIPCTPTNTSQPNFATYPRSPSSVSGPLAEIVEEEEEDGDTPRPIRETRSHSTSSTGSEFRFGAARHKRSHSRVSAASNTDNIDMYRTPKIFRSSKQRISVNVGDKCKNVKIWLQQGDILIGHDSDALDQDDTLSGLILEPLVQQYSAHQKSNPFTLLLSLQSSPILSLQGLSALVSSFEPNLFTTRQTEAETAPGLITVALTGSVIPWDSLPDHPSIFVELLWDSFNPETEINKTVIGLVAQYSSLGGKEGFIPVKRIEEAVSVARNKGLYLRVTDVPKWPLHAWEITKSQLEKMGVDFVQ